MSPTLRRTLSLLLIAAAGVYAVVHLSGPSGLNALLEKRQAVRQMEDAVQALETKVDSQAKYADEIRAGKPEVIIPLIRSRTGWVRDGEMDFRTAPEPDHAHKPAGPAKE